jgi:hypothetical protein
LRPHGLETVVIGAKDIGPGSSRHGILQVRVAARTR